MVKIEFIRLHMASGPPLNVISCLGMKRRKMNFDRRDLVFDVVIESE